MLAILPRECLRSARSSSRFAPLVVGCSKRLLSTPSSDPSRSHAAPATGQTVDLDFEAYEPTSEQIQKRRTEVPVSSLVVCHGLFGSKQNWRSLGRAMSSRFGVPVFALDLRNHGTSPHVDSLAYSDMAQDVINFMSSRKLSNVGLIGHSMGGKVSMSVALHPDLPQGMIRNLISVDMSAKRGPLSPEFERYIDAMIEIRDKPCRSRHEADTILQATESDLGVRQFLLTNLTRSPPGAETWSWRIPVDLIRKNIAQIGDFPYNPPNATEEELAGASESAQERSWNGETLFIKGTKSKYVNRKNIPTNQKYFTKSKLVRMDTGHWCQAEKPNEFVQVVEDFLTGRTKDETEEALRPRK
ncbi:alpha/beta hydrolase [Pseudozyma hubeiensis SY62]|uniref:Alpha/beta hydrolase n=1 Tax=Pseudozyma hubeiensis (strain SY62) TaxID=1305764 RepID=R9P497_PSEHS|nr:alpha/beta hydrolase [Pseudozyma hubeiensis SY62]GAC96129.1 alpha/beta hydrolase [Pseudozyma hubeiensis SY62]